MAIYAIGDLQGCHDELHQLLDKIRFDPAVDTLWLVGDLVNRGPRSLDTLRFVHSLGDAAITVLGNHDLHLLAVYAGLKPISPKNNLNEILHAPDCDELIDWLRRRPLLHHDDAIKFTLVHAGIYPLWSLETAVSLAQEAEQKLRDDEYRRLLKNMYGDTPDMWSNKMKGWQRLRFTINTFTRMRYCNSKGKMNLSEKGPPGSQPGKLMPWYELPLRQPLDSTVVFGHWSAHGLVRTSQVLGLDTGCVWGGELTAARLDADPVTLYSVHCHEHRRVKKATSGPMSLPG